MNPPSNTSAPVKLNSVFVTGHGIPCLEIPIEDLPRYIPSAERLKEIGHAPVTPYNELAPGCDLGADAVGHHKVPGSEATDPAGWSYHRDWLFGAFYDTTVGAFMVGYHRHPNGDEMAEGSGPGAVA